MSLFRLSNHIRPLRSVSRVYPPLSNQRVVGSLTVALAAAGVLACSATAQSVAPLETRGAVTIASDTQAVPEPQKPVDTRQPVNPRQVSDDAEATADDPMRQLQHDAIVSGKASWGHWGSNPEQYATWNNHSNRLIPMYTFGITLDELRRQGSAFANVERLQALFGRVPDDTLDPDAKYFDQTDVFALQQQAIRSGKRQVILVVFDGMDWDTTYAAALYKSGRVGYTEGRGTGLVMQDYRGTTTDFGFFVTSPYLDKVPIDVDAQTVANGLQPATGGYDPQRGGRFPWEPARSRDYLMGLDRSQPHTVTDSASSATSMTAGIKTYNAAINVDVHGNQVETIAHQLQRDRGMAIGVVTSVPISHATPAAAYSHNVTRKDYQDLTRDLIGLPSVAHRSEPLPGVDVLLGCGWGEAKQADAGQGANFVPGREFFDPEDLMRVSIERGGPYLVTQRTLGQRGDELLRAAAQQAIDQQTRLLGVFGARGGNLPFATASGDFNPTFDAQGQKQYTEADIIENPTLADMALAALDVLASNPNGFWLMVEAGDVDWANHANNLDNSIGATLSGDAAVAAIFAWIEQRDAWDETAVIVTADHGHYLVLREPAAIAAAGAAAAERRKN
jgi:alkaline phosphatase